MQELQLGEFKNSKLEDLSKEDIISEFNFLSKKFDVYKFELARALREVSRLKNEPLTNQQIELLFKEQEMLLKQEQFGASSERYKNPKKDEPTEKPAPIKKPAFPKTKKPSERYPNIPVREEIVAQNPAPQCTACGEQMSPTGMTEDSERLNVIPKKYEIILQKRMKYRCKCQGCVATAKAPERMVPGSSYSDEFIQDVTLSKYCDLIPIERYAAMAERSGLLGLPTQSLIELTHECADFLYPVYRQIKQCVFKSRVLAADETPHRMLEGDDKKSWYLWGFSNEQYGYFECHDTRSGNVASEVLTQSQCEYLITDVYSGYGKAVRTANQLRRLHQKVEIKNAHCNAHARRPFFKIHTQYPEAQFYLDRYQEIYEIEKKLKTGPPELRSELRRQMEPYFKEMREQAFKELQKYSSKSEYGKGLRYFIENYEGLTLCLKEVEIPLDNNAQERLLRNHVVGRKTWYGTHSKRGAETAAILFTLVETCRLNGVNPREFFKSVIEAMLNGKSGFTPVQFQKIVH